MTDFFYFLGVPIEHVQCSNVETEIWNRLSKFENQYSVNNFLKQRIQNISGKNGLFAGCQNNKTLNVFGLISQEDIDDALLIRITNTAKQAREFYFVSTNLPLLSKPILLIYALEKLSHLLALCTFKIPFVEQGKEKRYPHGVSYYDGIINIKQKGSYQLFHDSYSNDSDIYTKEYEFALEDLLRIGTKDVYRNESNFISYTNIFNLMKTELTRFIVGIKEHKSNNLLDIHELDREFLFIFAISTLARYKVNEWSKILEGKESDLILKIQEYTQTIESIFPNMILDYLFDTIFLFVPLAYLQKDDVRKIVEDESRSPSRAFR